MKQIINATNESFKDDIKSDTEVVLVDFWATWCGPCKMIAPILDEINVEQDKIKIVKVNVDENQEIAQKFRIRGIPTLMLFKNGEIIGSKTGAITKSNLLSWIDGIS